MFGRTGDVATLDEAIPLFREALAALAPGHRQRDLVLSNLGTALLASFERTGDVATLDDVVSLLRQAVAVTAPDDARRNDHLSNLSYALVVKFNRDKEHGLLAEALDLGRAALASAAPGTSDQAICLIVLGEVLRASYEHTGDAAALAEARRVFATAGRMTSTTVRNQVSALRKAADADLLADEPDHALEMVKQAVARVPRVTTRRLGRDDREHQAVGLAGLASTAAAAAIAAGDPGLAVELLEQTRGILLADTFDTRGDLTELRDREPSLARELDRLREEIEDADQSARAFAAPDAQTPQDTQELAERRARLAQRWTELLARIRAMPGWEGFLRPPPIDRLREQAADGPVVYVTAHDRGGHALIVTDDEDRPVRVVALPDLAQAATQEQADVLRDARHAASNVDLPAAERRAAQQRILDVLGWLWDTVTEPVLRDLGHTAAPAEGDPWPRLWWCPTGVCAFLPLHAAGRHGTAATATALDRVISSYTPTIRALSQARAARALSPSRTDKATAASLVIVAVPDAPASAPLPGVTREAALLRELVPDATTLPPPGTSATRESVTAALPGHRIAHFACHGLADLAMPAHSRLLLHDYAENPLTVGAVARLRLGHGELAYLSACETTGTAGGHADEAIHLASAFQLAGYQAVIGTLWPVNDDSATAIARDFYARLTRDGTTAPATATAAAALHHSLRAHRDRYPALPTRWAAHVHNGL